MSGAKPTENGTGRSLAAAQPHLGTDVTCSLMEETGRLLRARSVWHGVTAACCLSPGQGVVGSHRRRCSGFCPDRREGSHRSQWLWSQGALKITQLQPAAMGRVANHRLRAASNLECLLQWGTHNLFQRLNTPQVKNLLLSPNLNLPSLSLKPFPLALPLSDCVKSRPPSCL